MASDSLSARAARAARDLQAQDDDQGVLQTAVDIVVDHVEGCDAASITLVHRKGRIHDQASTDPVASTGDRLQLELREGPFHDETWEGDTVQSPSLGHDLRWPRWGPAVVAQTGAQSMMSFRLFTQDDTLGALTMYSRTRDGFGAADRDQGLALAAHIALAVTASRQITNLNAGLGSRSVIGQALGMLMERFNLPVDRAFAVLSRISQGEGRKLHDVAAELVLTRQLPRDTGPTAAIGDTGSAP